MTSCAANKINSQVSGIQFITGKNKEVAFQLGGLPIPLQYPSFEVAVDAVLLIDSLGERSMKEVFMWTL